MTERRFRIEAPLVPGQSVRLEPRIAQHAKVLRLAAGDRVVLFDGLGSEADATLAGEGEGWLAFVEQVREAREPWDVVLVAGVPKAGALEALLRGATEAGVSEVRLFVAERSVAHPDGERASRKRERWRRIVEEAARQSERARVPSVCWSEGLLEALGPRTGRESIVALDARAGVDLRSILRHPARTRVLVLGPEGGLSPAEIALVVARGGVLARAPLPVLRVETAACVLTALAALASAPEPGESAQDDAGPHLR